MVIGYVAQTARGGRWGLLAAHLTNPNRFLGLFHPPVPGWSVQDLY